MDTVSPGLGSHTQADYRTLAKEYLGLQLRPSKAVFLSDKFGHQPWRSDIQALESAIEELIRL